MMDVDPEHPAEISKFERAFGAPYVRPEDYEVYGIEDTLGGFSESEIRELLPFQVNSCDLFNVAMENIRSVFFVVTKGDWDRNEAEGIRITDVVEIESFKYE